MEIFSGFWSLLLSFILIFLLPFYLAETRRAMINDIRIISEGDSFLTELCFSGYIEREGMNQFLKTIEDGQTIRKVSLRHRRRVVKPVSLDGELSDTKDFYIEVPFEEVKEKLKENGKYYFSVGDEISLSIEDQSKSFPFYGIKPIVIGGVVENEFEEN